MFDELKDYIEAGVFALVIALAILITHKIDAAHLAKVQANYATQESTRNALVLADYGKAVIQRDALQKQIDDNALATQTAMKGKNDEIDTLNARLAAGTSSVRVVGYCPKSSASTGSKLPETASVDTSGQPRLTDAAQQDYIALRRAIVFQAGQVAACRAYAQAMNK